MSRAAFPLVVALAIAAFLGLVSQAAGAATVGVHLVSSHWNVDPATPPGFRPRSETPGLYVRTDADHVFGIVRNSFGRTSLYAGHVWETHDGRFALTLGVISGYRKQIVTGQQVCRPGYLSVPGNECRWVHGHTSAHLRVLVTPSIALPAIAGATPRLNLLGKGLNLSVEWRLP